MIQTEENLRPPHQTRQRRLVWEVIKASPEHLDAESIYLRAKERSPQISLATVYRTLTFLKNAGLVNELSLGEDHNHYEAVHTTPHEHFTCLSCGRVIELETPQFYDLARRLGAQQGLQITGVDLHLTGYCPNCATT